MTKKTAIKQAATALKIQRNKIKPNIWQRKSWHDVKYILKLYRNKDI